MYAFALLVYDSPHVANIFVCGRLLCEADNVCFALLITNESNRWQRHQETR